MTSSPRADDGYQGVQAEGKVAGVPLIELAVLRGPVDEGDGAAPEQAQAGVAEILECRDGLLALRVLRTRFLRTVHGQRVDAYGEGEHGNRAADHGPGRGGGATGEEASEQGGGRL